MSAPDTSREAWDTAIAACRDDLAANRPADAVLNRLRAFEATARADPALRARWLIAAAIATNRLGLPGEALGALIEACTIAAELGDGTLAADAYRTVALVHGWRGDGREAALALLRALAESLAAGDRQGAALALIEAGRLEIEIGRPHAAGPLLARAHDLGGDALPAIERRRSEVNRLQVLVAAGDREDARRYRDAIAADIASASPRLRLLVQLEDARLARLDGRTDQARAALAAARALVPHADSFEAVECAEVEAELALAEGDPARAEALLAEIVDRCAADDLAGREVRARLAHARALDGLGRREAADATLAAGLRRALERGLTGYADAGRAALALRGGAEGVWATDAAPRGARLHDPGRRFVRRRPIGAGAFGSVMRAYDIELGGEVALKRIVLSGVYDTAERERLLASARTEAVAASRIDHPGVARVRGLLVDAGGDALLIQDHVEGASLRSRLPWTQGLAAGLDLLARVAFALAAVHAAGVVHLDVKPENIVIDASHRPVLVDFGIAMATGARAGRGTPDYMAPEQRAGRRVDGRTDLFALGVVACELLAGIGAGALPRGAWASRRVIRDTLAKAGLDVAAMALVDRLIAPRRWRRPRAAAEVGRAFADAAARLRTGDSITGS